MMRIRPRMAWPSTPEKRTPFEMRYLSNPRASDATPRVVSAFQRMVSKDFEAVIPGVTRVHESVEPAPIRLYMGTKLFTRQYSSFKLSSSCAKAS